MEFKPTALNRQIEPRLVFVRRTFLPVKERPVDQLDVDPAVLPSLDAASAVSKLVEMKERGRRWGKGINNRRPLPTALEPPIAADPIKRRSSVRVPRSRWLRG